MTTKHERPLPKRDFSPIDPYQQGKSVLGNTANPIKLSSNESSYGPSPKAIEAYHSVENVLFRYPDGAQHELRQAIAEIHNLDIDKIICGSGSDELLGLLIRAYAGEADELLLTENHFVMCPIYARTQGITIVLAPEDNYRIDVDSILRMVSDKTRMVIIANPNPPTGTWITGREIKQLHDKLPGDILLIIDAAYAEYVAAGDYDAGFGLVDEFENVVVTRTFSKIYGLAGLRIGWAYCPDHVIDTLQRVRSPFNTTSAALAAAAAAVRDVEYIKSIREKNTNSLKKISSSLTAAGLRVVPGVANFYLTSFTGVEGKTASGAAKYLESKGIIPRPVNSSTDDALRITVGNDAENDAVITALTEYMSNRDG